jgi:hypothetical protein
MKIKQKKEDIIYLEALLQTAPGLVLGFVALFLRTSISISGTIPYPSARGGVLYQVDFNRALMTRLVAHEHCLEIF